MRKIDPARGDPELRARLSELVQRAGSAAALAARAGISARSLGYYLAGVEPPRRAIVALARAAGVSIEWLAAGAEAESPTLELIERALSDVEEILAFDGIDIGELTPRLRVELYMNAIRQALGSRPGGQEPRDQLRAAIRAGYQRLAPRAAEPHAATPHPVPTSHGESPRARRPRPTHAPGTPHLRSRWRPRRGGDSEAL